MTDLTEFLLARVAEDEWDARRALGLDMRARLKDQAEQVVSRHGSHVPSDKPSAADSLWWTAQDVVQWLAPYGPARVLVECESKRRIMEECADLASSEDVYTHADLILHALALPYAHHPDCREKWQV